MFVREVNYVPDWQYLQKQQFDISKTFYGKGADDFTGTMIVKDWNENLLTMYVLSNGKITRNISTKRTGSNNQNQLTTSTGDCTWMEYCMWYEDCVVVGDMWTNDCGMPYEDPTDCFMQQNCSGDGGDPCIIYGICTGSGGYQNIPPQPDPCDAAKAGSTAATTFSANSKFIIAKGQIANAASDGNEHEISFGKDANGNIITSAMNTGNDNSGTVTNVSNQFADLHNHPSDLPPSSGDLYYFIDQTSSSSLYQTKYVVTQNGTVYALVVTDLQAAENFNTNYPRVLDPGVEPNFPDNLFEEYSDIDEQEKGLYSQTPQQADELAIAYILEKYNAGVALLKMDGSGSFKKISTKYDANATGNPYSQQICP